MSKPLDLKTVTNWTMITTSTHWAPVPDMPREEREELVRLMNKAAWSGDEARMQRALMRKLAYRAAREMTEQQLADRDNLIAAHAA